MRLAFVGGGTMAEAMVASLLRKGVASPGEIAVSDVLEARRDYLHKSYGIVVTAENQAALQGAEMAILAVKPQNLPGVLEELKGKLTREQVVLSIVAGASIKSIVGGMRHEAVIRAMPNTPGQVGLGITVWNATEAVLEGQRKVAATVLEALGQQVFVPDEKLIDMATALSASGPAYVFLFIEALIDAGVYLGMPRELARQLAVQTVVGSGTMLGESGKHPAELRDMVTSPGGTTAEALLALEDGGFRAAVMNAVVAAYEKAKLLGEESQR